MSFYASRIELIDQLLGDQVVVGLMLIDIVLYSRHQSTIISFCLAEWLSIVLFHYKKALEQTQNFAILCTFKLSKLSLIEPSSALLAWKRTKLQNAWPCVRVHFKQYDV